VLVGLELHRRGALHEGTLRASDLV
jgi:hypothetical protein